MEVKLLKLSKELGDIVRHGNGTNLEISHLGFDCYGFIQENPLYDIDSNIECLNCRHLTAPGFPMSADSKFHVAEVGHVNSYTFECLNCKSTMTMCGKCYYHDKKVILCELKNTPYNNPYEEKRSPSESCHCSTIDENNDVEDSDTDDSDAEKRLIWDKITYVYNGKKYGPITGYDGGGAPEYYCSVCKTDFYCPDL